jgi:hypothetical protein
MNKSAEEEVSAEHLQLLRQAAVRRAAEESKAMPTYLKRIEIPILMFKINRLERRRRDVTEEHS